MPLTQMLKFDGKLSEYFEWMEVKFQKQWQIALDQLNEALK